MDLGAIFEQLGGDVLTNTTIQAVFLVSILDFVLGSIKAATNKTFALAWVDAWVGDHVLKAVTILFALVFGLIAPDITIGDFSFSIVGVTAEAAAVTYVVKTAASALANLNFGSTDSPPRSVEGTSPDL